MASLLFELVPSTLINAISGKGRKGGFLPLALPLMKKVLGKGETRAVRGYDNRDHMDENF